MNRTMGAAATGYTGYMYPTFLAAPYAAFTPAQLVAGNKHHVARSKLLVITQLVARNKHQVARNLLRATCCAGVDAALVVSITYNTME